MDGTSAMVIRSEDVGKPENGDLIFRFDESYLDNDISTALGVHQVEKAPSNAEFYINDSFHTSISNRISLNHTMDLDLLSTSEEPIHVGYVPDEEKLSDKINDFINSYNALIDISRNETGQHGANRLYHDITQVARRHLDELNAAGVSIDENGHLIRNEDDDIFSSSRIQALFNDKISDFRKDLSKATGKMTLNPLDYVDKVVVTYPDTIGNTYPNPYNPSKYSGLLFNDYR
jgi:flagellar hook-associated protein 2